MTPKPESESGNPPRTRRLSKCYLHPADPATGICPSCLRERLCGLDSSCDPEPFCSAGNGGGGNGTRPISCVSKAAGTSPELRRCNSVITAKCEATASTSSLELRRKSCDVRVRNWRSLARLFDVDDECNGSNGESKVESKNILKGPVIELGEEDKVKDGGELGDFYGALERNANVDDENDDNEEVEEFKTMKEYIDLALQSKSQKLKLAGNIREAASVFSKKLQKWRQKQKKKLSYSIGGGNVGAARELNGLQGQKLVGETQSEAADYGMSRRSCDTEPRFSVDAGRLSMDGGRISFDEPRASWDGYLIARTIPRLAPMLSVVENAILSGGNRIDNNRVSVDGQMLSIMEDESSSGGSAQSNSDSSCSQLRSSFDRSSSVRSFGKKFVGLEADEMKYALNARVSPAKLVITERELKDWHLNSIKDDHLKKFEPASKENSMAVEDGGNMGSKKSVRWRKMWNVFGFKQKSCESKCEKSVGNSVDSSPAQACEKQEKDLAGREVKDATGWKLMRSSSIVGARRSCEVIRTNNSMTSLADDVDCATKGREEFVIERNQSAKYTSKNFDDGVLPFYLTPLRSSRSIKSGKNKLQNSNFVHGNILQLN